MDGKPLAFLYEAVGEKDLQTQGGEPGWLPLRPTRATTLSNKNHQQSPLRRLPRDLHGGQHDEY
jgi:hypothetical protein